MKSKILLLFILQIIFIDIAFAAEPLFIPKNRIAYGINISPAYNMYSSNFVELPGVPNCCPDFTTGGGMGFSFTGIFNYPLNELLFISARAGLVSLSGAYTITEPTYVLLPDQTQADGQFEHSLKTSLMLLDIEPMLGYNVYKDLRLHVGFGVGFFLSNSYEQKETIVKPSNYGTFTDTKTRIRNQQSGTITGMSNPNLSILAGLSYYLPLNSNKSLFLAPEVMYRYGLTNTVSDISWKINSLRFGISLLFSPVPVPVIIEEKPEEDFKI